MRSTKRQNATRSKSRPKWARLQYVVEAEAAALRTISMSAPLQSLRMKSGSTCARGGRGQGARYALLVTQPKARSCDPTQSAQHQAARRMPHAGRTTARARPSKPAQEHQDRKKVGDESRKKSHLGLLGCR